MIDSATTVHHRHSAATGGNRGVRRVFGRLVVAVGAVLATLIVSAAPAHAAYELVGHLQNWATGACLDSNARGDVYTLPCQGGNGWQTWHIRGAVGKSFDGYDQVTLQNEASGRCLQIYLNADSRPVSLTFLCGSFTDPTPVNRIDGVGPDWGNVHLRASTNVPGGRRLCQDSVGSGSAYALDCNYGTYQTWRLI